jgi:hypothetical protein
MNGRKIFLALISLLEWAGLIAQLILHMRMYPGQPAESLIRFFIFFTILTNMLVAVLVTLQWLGGLSRCLCNSGADPWILCRLVSLSVSGRTSIWFNTGADQ